jgi:ribonuclease HI
VEEMKLLYTGFGSALILYRFGIISEISRTTAIVSHQPHCELTQWLPEWIGTVKDSEMDTTMMTLYQMWLARNGARESRMMENPELIARRAVALTDEWRNIQNPKQPKTPTPKEHWLPPDVGWTKLNADGTLAKSSGHGGGGVVARDHHGSYLAGACHFFPSVTDPEEAEVRACKQAVSLAKDMHLMKIILETDSKGVVSKLTSKDQDRWALGPLVKEIKSMLRSVDNHVVKWARRSANGVAHKLAKVGCGSELCNNWMFNPPDCIADFLDSDLAGN